MIVNPIRSLHHQIFANVEILCIKNTDVSITFLLKYTKL